MDTKECIFLITQQVITEMPYLQFEAAYEELHLWGHLLCCCSMIVFSLPCECCGNTGYNRFPQHSVFDMISFNPYPTAFPYGNGMVLHFYQQQEGSTTKTVHKVINRGLKTYV